MYDYFDAAREELESEENARFDYISEAYGPTARDADRFSEGEYEYYRAEAIAKGEWHQTEFAFEIRGVHDADIPF